MKNKINRKKTKYKVVRTKREIALNISIIIAFILICIVTLIFTFAMFISKVTIKEDATVGYVKGYSAATVISGSMEPTLHVGDIAIIQKKEEYHLGDIITFFTEDGEVYTHRIVSIGDMKYKTKGDANNIEDDFIVYKNNVIGVVEYRIPYVGKYIKYLSDKVSSYYTILLVFFISILVLVEVIDVYKVLKADFTKEELDILEKNRKKKMLKKALKISNEKKKKIKAGD